MSKKVIIIFIIIGIFIVTSFFITRETAPSPDTRVILEHDHKTYIAPICFEDSNATNHIEDATLEMAHDSNYKANGTCTEDALKSEVDSLFTSILKEIGILDKKWDKW